MFEQFSGAPRGRERRRLLASFGAASAVYAGAGLALAWALSTAVAPPVEEEPVDVKFFKAPPPAPPAPPPPTPAAAPPPPPPPPKAAQRPATPRVKPPQPFEAPASLPTAPPSEADPSQETGSPGSTGEGDPAGLPGGREGGREGGTPNATGDAPPSAAPPGPVVLPPGATPPVRLNPQDKPDYPHGARSAGIEGEVVVKIAVQVDGTVALVKVVKSAPPFDEAVKAFLPKLRYQPAVYNGRPIAVYQNVRFPFTLR